VFRWLSHVFGWLANDKREWYHKPEKGMDESSEPEEKQRGKIKL